MTKRKKERRPDMKKSEKILVVASVLAVIWGGVVTFGKKPIKDTDLHQAEDINLFISAVTDKVKGDSKSALNSYILSQALKDWGKSPFLVKGMSSKGMGIDYVYTGYVQNGKTIIALINNREYRAGEHIEGTGFEVKSINPNWVILVENKMKKRVLPLEGGM
jgi:hypothetical protein